MTETRKQIIELIEPFMDKTLSEGCIIDNETHGLVRMYNHANFLSEKYPIQEGFLYNFYLNGKSKIIGHYDITAVEMFFIEKGSTILVHKNCYEVRGRGVLDRIEYLAIFYGNFPRKPLYLYTEEQDKNLLELLKEIGQKK